MPEIQPISLGRQRGAFRPVLPAAVSEPAAGEPGEVCRQYAGLSAALGAAAAELAAELAPDPMRERRLRQYFTALGLEAEPAVYYNERGRLRLEVAGTGLQSLRRGETVKKLSQLLGVPMRLAEEEPRRADRVVLVEREPFMALAGAAARRKDGETVSGDTGAWFKHEDGSLYVLLCDGMGSGPAAHRESSEAARLLEQFLRAGVPPEEALPDPVRGTGPPGRGDRGLYHHRFDASGPLYRCGNDL